MIFFFSVKIAQIVLNWNYSEKTSEHLLNGIPTLEWMQKKETISRQEVLMILSELI